MTDARVASEAVKALHKPAPRARVGSVAVKVLRSLAVVSVPEVQIAAVAAKALHNAHVHVQVDAQASKVLRRLDPDPIAQWNAWNAGWSVDFPRSKALIGWIISYGRFDANARVQPTSATVTLAGAIAQACPVAGDRFRLCMSQDFADTAGLSSETAARFTGEVTDASIDPSNPVSDVYTITAVGRLGRARRRPLDGTGWPQELDGPRVTRILTDAGIADQVGTIDAGTADLLKPTQRTLAGALLDLVADSTTGQVIEQPSGDVDWHDAEHRRGSVPVLDVDQSEILNTIRWDQHVSDLVNDAAIGYGIDGAEFRVVDPVSIDARESYPLGVTTALPDASTAQSLGALIVGRRSEPVWQLPQLVVDLERSVTSAKAAQLLQLRHGDRIRVTGLPAGGPYSADVEVFVEGYQETKKAGLWRLSLAVSDTTLSGVTLRWQDAPADLTWSGVDPTLTWLDLARIEDPTELGA